MPNDYLDQVQVGSTTYDLQDSAAQADLSQLKSQINAIEELTTTEESETTTVNIFPNLTWTSGYMGLDGATHSGESFRYSNKISVSEGDVIAFQNSIFTFSYVTAFTDNTAVSNKGETGGNSYTVPADINGIVITEYVSRGEAAILRTHTSHTLVNILSDDVAAIDSALEERYVWEMNDEVVSWTTGKYKEANGSTTTASGLNYSSAIDVNEGDIILYSNDNYTLRFVCALDANGNAIAAKGSNDTKKFYIVPAGIKSVIVSVYDSAMNSGANLLHITRPIEKRAKIVPYGNGSMVARASTMSDDDTITLPLNNCKIGSRYQFSCAISEFGSIEFAMGTTHVIIDDTNIIFKNGTTTQATVPHGLDIGTELLLMFQNETSIRPSYVSVSSMGNRFEYDGSPNITFLLDNGVPTIKCIDGELTNCTFSFTSSHIFAPVWVFGDSYLSWYAERWTYYAAEDGNTDNVFLSGYAGENSQAAIEALNNELQLATPKILVWCLGMNDPDTDSAVNAGWDMVYNQLKEICADRNIELVLYTTPTTPIMNNRFKNAIVRASGYRYVDIDGLLRINDDGDWIAGTLASDNVHPTVLGGKIIYHKFLADLPEIMSKFSN